jgi:divalent metal cation (Fe/Co/Zn/Cd) transporter
MGRPPTGDRRYTYGYGRAEDLAGLAVIAVMTISAARLGLRVSSAATRLASRLVPRSVRLSWVGRPRPSQPANTPNLPTPRAPAPQMGEKR